MIDTQGVIIFLRRSALSRPDQYPEYLSLCYLYLSFTGDHPVPANCYVLIGVFTPKKPVIETCFPHILFYTILRPSYLSRDYYSVNGL